MLAYVKSALFKRLATVSFAAGCGAVTPTSDLAALPCPVIDELVAEGFAGELETEESKRLLSLLACDPRPAVRSAAAEATPGLAQVSLPDAEDVLRPLAGDESAGVRTSAATALAGVLEEAAPLDRVELMSRWSLAEPPAERQAIARALGYPVAVGGARLALTHLVRDPQAAVRQSALQAASRRFAELPTLVESLAVELVLDPDRHVRRLARRALADARGVG